MTNEPLYILVADYVPLANKGEEAIVRGISDMLGGERDVRLGLFDHVEDVTDVAGITVFPINWVFRQAGWVSSGVKHSLKAMAIGTQLLLGIHSRLANMVSDREPAHRPLRDFFDKAQYVLVGHNGAFCIESCGVIHLARKAGKKCGVLGMSGGVGSFGQFYKRRLYRRTQDESDFWVFREASSQQSMQKISKYPEKLLLAPDPAFAMRPADREQALEILQSYELYERARASGAAIVAATVLEKGRVFYNFAPGTDPETRRDLHADYLASIFDAVIQQRGACVIFLPHSIEGDGNDVTAARNVTARMTSPPESYMIMDEDLPARVLKSIIRECDFLIGQRTHSLIGGISVGTPLLGLSNSSDTRTHGIVGAMCRCEQWIIDMDTVECSAAAEKAVVAFDNRASTGTDLEVTRQQLFTRLTEVADMIKSAPPRRN